MDYHFNNDNNKTPLPNGRGDNRSALMIDWQSFDDFMGFLFENKVLKRGDNICKFSSDGWREDFEAFLKTQKR